MNFQQPNYLWFLFLLIIPLLIHLINFQRTKVLLFPGVYRLIEKLQVTQQQKKLQNWLIWLMRTLALLFLILAFCLPTCNSKSEGNSGIDGYIIVWDNSLSAKVQGEQGESLEIMRTEMRRYLEGLNSNQPVYLITQSSDEGSGWVTPKEIIQGVDTMDCAVQYNGWKQWKNQVEKALKIGRDNFSLSPQRTRVLVFTDLEQSSFAGISGPLSVTQSTAITKAKDSTGQALMPPWQVVRFPLSAVPNVAIDSAWTVIGDDAAKVPSLKVKIKNWGSNSENTLLSVKSSGKILANQSIAIPAKGEEVVAFAMGALPAEGLIIEKNRDAFPWDDRLYLHPSPNWAMLVGLLGNSVSLDKLFSVQKGVSVQRLRRPLEWKQLAKLQSVCLLGNDRLSEQEATLLQDFMDRGGVVFQAMDREPLAASWMIQSPFGEILARTEKGEFFIDKSGFSHPVFRDAFTELPSKETAMPSIQQRMVLGANKLADFSVVLSGESGEPVLIQESWGKGSYWLWCSGLQTGSATWMKSQWVLPVFTEVVSANNKRNFPLFGWVKTNTVIPIAGINATKDRGISLEYLGDGTQGARREMPMARWIKEWQQDLTGMGGIYLGDQPELPGYYRVKNGEETKLLALNLPRNESAMVVGEELQSAAKTLGIEKVEVVDYEAMKSVADKTTSSTVWKWFLWLSIGFLCVETAIQWYKNKSIKQG